MRLERPESLFLWLSSSRSLCSLLPKLPSLPLNWGGDYNYDIVPHLGARLEWLDVTPHTDFSTVSDAFSSGSVTLTHLPNLSPNIQELTIRDSRELAQILFAVLAVLPNLTFLEATVMSHTQPLSAFPARSSVKATFHTLESLYLDYFSSDTRHPPASLGSST